MPGATLSICIVNWNTRDYLRDCLQSLLDTSAGLYPEIIVVDNASSDGSVEMVSEEFPDVTLLANDENLGYAAANNQALDRATGELKLLLNPDVVFPDGGLRGLVDAMDRHPQAGAVAPRLVHPDGRWQQSCRGFPDPDVILYEFLGLSRLFPRSRRFGRYRMGWWEHDDERAVDQPMASVFLLRSEALAEVGHFDEQFRIFFNDVDLCARIWQAGWEIWFTPEVSIVHHVGASTRQVRAEMVRESHEGLLRYYEKHYRGQVGGLTYAIVRGLIRLGGIVRHAWARLRA